MKLCHIALLASIGWYLMIPPFEEKDSEINEGAPISEWNLFNPSIQRQNAKIISINKTSWISTG